MSKATCSDVASWSRGTKMGMRKESWGVDGT